jgi:hypothetical protein
MLLLIYSDDLNNNEIDTIFSASEENNISKD